MARSVGLVSKYAKALEKFNNIFGFIPPGPSHLSVCLIKEEFYFTDDRATKEIREFKLDYDSESFCFNIICVVPREKNAIPLSILIGDGISRAELISEYEKCGGAVYYINASRLFSAKKIYKSDLYRLCAKSRRKHHSPSAIGVYTHIILRTLEYAKDLGYIDMNNISVSGEGLYNFSCLGAYLIGDGRVGFDISTLDSEILKVNTDSESLYCPAFLRSNEKENQIDEFFSSLNNL